MVQCFEAPSQGWRWSTFAYCVGRSKGKGPGEKLALLAVQCLEALLRLGKTTEGVADLLHDVPLTPDQEPTASDAGVHRHSLWTDTCRTMMLSLTRLNTLSQNKGHSVQSG